MSGVVAAIPQVWLDLGIAAGIVSTCIGAAFAVTKLMGGLWKGFRSAVREATDDIRCDVAEIKHLTNYHLGPNGDTEPIHKRLKRLEIVHGTDPDRKATP